MTRAKPQTNITFAIDAKTLTGILAGLLPVIGKENIPILRTVLIETGDGEAVFSATDMDLQIRTTSAAETNQPWKGCVDLRLLHAMVSKASGLIKFSANGTHVGLDDDSGVRANILYRKADEYPAALEPDNWQTDEATIPAMTLRGLLAKVLPAITEDESRYALQGARVRTLDGRLEAVGTDGGRLAIATTESAVSIAEVIVPRKGLVALLKLLNDGEVAVAQSDNLLRFTIGNTALTVRKLAGQFPNVELVLSGSTPDSLILGTAALTTALDRLIPLRDDKIFWTKWTLTNGKLRLESIKADAGDGSAEVDCDWQGASFVFGLDSPKVLAALREIGAETLMFRFDAKNAGKPVLFETDGFRYLLCTINPKLL